MVKNVLIKLMGGALLLSAACNEKPGYTITGTTDNNDLNGQYVYLSASVKDSALITDNTFVFRGVQDTAVVAKLFFPDGVIKEKPELYGGFDPYQPWFVLDNSKLSVHLGVNSTVNGSPENDALTAYMQQLDALYDNHSDLEAMLQSKNDTLINQAESRWEEIDAQALPVHLAYIQSHNNSLAGAKVFYDNRYTLPEEVQRKLIASAGDIFKSAPGIDKRIEHLAVLEKVSVGKKFTDFEMADPQGKMHKLSEYTGKGKVVLIDFWASWCPPCRRDIPHLIEVYNQYKGKGFEIVGISLDRTGEAWQNGIKTLHITWPQLSDLNYWKNAGAALYGVNSIPHTVLIDKDGVIIAKRLRGEALSKKLAELFGKP
jgi:peroxiredoxin